MRGDHKPVPSQNDMDRAYAIAVTNKDLVVDERNAAYTHHGHPDESSSPPTVESSAEDVPHGLNVEANTAEPTLESLPCLCQ